MQKKNETAATCEICGKKIKGDSQQAELSSTDNKYYSDGVPAGHASQGWFDIGPDCFKKKTITSDEAEVPRGKSYYDRERDLW